jgi:excisionase family DNA binding protein
LSRGFSGLIYARDTESPAEEHRGAGAFLQKLRTRNGGVEIVRNNVVAGEISHATCEGIMADSREVMNIRQASQYLGVSPDTLYKYVGEQKIPAFKLGNRWRFKKSKLDQWMEEKSTQMEPRAKRRPKAASKAAGQV